MQRPDKMAAAATLPGDTRCFYFDGKYFSLLHEENYVYSMVPMETSLDQLPAELARIHGFTPPLAEFLVSDLYQDLVWCVEQVDYRGADAVETGFLPAKRVRCHRLGLIGKRADSELWVDEKDLLPRRRTSKLKESEGEVVITFEFSNWNLKAKTRDKDFDFASGEDFLEVPMVTEAEMAAAREAATQDAGGKR